MREFFDSSVLIAALDKTHPRHRQARPRVRNDKREVGLAAHSQHALFEVYAVLTGLNGSRRWAPAAVLAAMEDVFAGIEVVALNPEDYHTCLSEARQKNILGGTIYDALHAQAALEWGADQLITLNRRHFERILAGTGIAVADP